MGFICATTSFQQPWISTHSDNKFPNTRVRPFEEMNSQSLEDTQVGYILQKYTLDKYAFEKYILEKYTLEKYTLGEYTLRKYTFGKYTAGKNTFGKYTFGKYTKQFFLLQESLIENRVRLMLSLIHI